MKIIFGALALALTATGAWSEGPRSIEAVKAGGFGFAGLESVRAAAAVPEPVGGSSVKSIRVGGRTLEVIHADFFEGNPDSALLAKEYEFEFARFQSSGPRAPLSLPRR